MYVLRDYQKRSVAAGQQIIKNKKKELLVEPTGAGKSLIIASIVKDQEHKVLVLQPSKEILEQNYSKMLDFGYTDIAIYSASLKSKETAKTTFATIGSIKNKAEIFKDIELIIIDEAHNVAGKDGMYNSFIQELEAIKEKKIPVIGLTATPYRMSQNYKWVNGKQTDEKVYVTKFLHRTRPRVFTGIANITQIGELFEKGYLQKPEYEVDPTYNQQEIKMNKTGSNFDMEAMEKYNELQNLPKKAYNKVIESESQTIIVFVKFLKESKIISELLNKAGIRTATVDSSTKPKDREQILQDFKKGEIRVVVNVGVLTTGFDFPGLEEVIIARPMLSVALFYQIAGRVVRPTPNGRSTKLVDLAGNINRFGQLEDFEIVEIKKGLHRLKSEVGYLTGVSIKNGEDIEALSIKTTEVEKGDKMPEIIPFGKYKGTHIKKLKTNYLEWMVENFTDGRWKETFQQELERRREKKLSTFDVKK